MEKEDFDWKQEEKVDCWVRIHCNCGFKYTVLLAKEPPFEMKTICKSCGKQEILIIK